jgi:hypothetical protein
VSTSGGYASDRHRHCRQLKTKVASRLSAATTLQNSSDRHLGEQRELRLDNDLKY